MKRSKRCVQCRIADLPEEVLLDILSRLSIKSILTCRCVSKTWLKLLSSSNTHFTKLHFTRSPVQLILQITSGCFHFVELEDDTDLDNTIKPVIPRFRLSSCDLVVINSCNGFLCLAQFNMCHFTPVKVCNPITGEYLNLPKSKVYDYLDRDVVSGFGFCAKTNQYKVVRLVHRRGIFKDRVVEVYTIGTKSWRNIGTAPEYPSESFCTTFFNGKIYWVCDDRHSSDFIISFDVESEKFGNVPSPPHFSPNPESITERYDIKIGVLGEFLYMSYRMELWVMKEYGSWNKVGVDRGVDRPVESPQAIKYLSGGKILMVYDDSKLVSYDPVKDISKEFKVPQLRWGFETVSHVPSFMSFNDAMMGDKCAELRTTICRVQRKRRSTRRD